MKVLYGVVGEGMGHAMRSRVVLEHLVQQGHHVEIMASSRAVDYLARRFQGVRRIHGLHIITDENRVRIGRTLWSNALKGASALPRQIRSYFDLIEDFRPEIVISDFESWSYFYAKAHRLPVLSIDNMQVVNRCKHGPEILQGERARFEVARAFIKSKLPFCQHYLITTFFFPPIRKERTTLYPPILRREVLEAQPTRGEHLLVYQTAAGYERLADTLKELGVEARIYGMRRDLAADHVDGNLRYRPFDERAFIEDLASARAVIAGGGFTLMGECVYLHKPMLALPIEGYFEQILSSRYLQHEGYGCTASHATVDTIRDFLKAVPEYEANLARYQQDGNKALMHALDELLDRAAANVL